MALNLVQTVKVMNCESHDLDDRAFPFKVLSFDLQRCLANL